MVSASVKNFNDQMAYLAERYNVISLDEFVDSCKKIKPLPKNSVIITFDDGYKDNYDFAYPALKKYRLPATIFLTTGAIEKQDYLWWEKLAYALSVINSDSIEIKPLVLFSLKNRNAALKKIVQRLKRCNDDEKNAVINKLLLSLKVSLPKRRIYLNWDEIKKMTKNKVSFGAHTVNHPILTRIPLKQAEKEIRDSRRLIEQKINKKVNSFSYPNGREHDFNDRIIGLLKKEGFSCAVTYIPGWNRPESDLFRLKRVFVRHSDDLVMFKNKMIGADILPAKIYQFLRNLGGRNENFNY
jgi:peptidoglycan/xylan/chitin deacetylase (PgdA/CDA1 family)